VNKGDEFGHFQFGGSDIILLVQAGVATHVDTNTSPDTSAPPPYAASPSPADPVSAAITYAAPDRVPRPGVWWWPGPGSNRRPFAFQANAHTD